MVLTGFLSWVVNIGLLVIGSRILALSYHISLSALCSLSIVRGEGRKGRDRRKTVHKKKEDMQVRI